MNLKRVRVLLIAMLLGICGSDYAEVACFNAAADHLRYEIVSDLKFFAYHPFRVITGNIIGITGVLLADPHHIEGGMKLDATIPITGLYADDPRLDSALLESWRRKNAIATFHASGIDINAEVNPSAPVVTLVGEISTRHATRVIHVPLQCEIRERAIRCEVGFNFRLSSFSLARPTFAGFPVNDTIRIAGDVVFRLKK